MSAVTIPDVVYGRKFGLALMLDIVKPAQPSGAGVLALSSGGWRSWPETGKPDPAAFVKRGLTVFIVMHGSRPKFGIPEIVADIRLALRFVREHAGAHGVAPDRLGLFGISSGGHIALLTAAQAGRADRVGAVACFYPPTDLLNFGAPGRIWVPYRLPDETADDATLARAWSPVTHFTAAMPPPLIIHGAADVLVPIQQARTAIARLRELGVECRLEARPGQAHGWPDMAADHALCAEWLELRLAASSKDRSASSGPRSETRVGCNAGVERVLDGAYQSVCRPAFDVRDAACSVDNSSHRQRHDHHSSDPQRAH